MTTTSGYIDETIAYLNEKERRGIVWELLGYAQSLYKRVYVFKNYEAFSRSFEFDGDSPPKEYWEGLSYEALIDSIKICCAFENYNKAVLLSKGFVVHSIDQKKNSMLAKQQAITPVLISDFLVSNSFREDENDGELYLEGFKNLATISFSRTLSPSYQQIIGLENQFIHYLMEATEERNRLHFNKNYPGAKNVRIYLARLKYMMDYGTSLLETEIQKVSDLQKKFDD